jgi:hypothetical protein
MSLNFCIYVLGIRQVDGTERMVSVKLFYSDRVTVKNAITRDKNTLLKNPKKRDLHLKA